MMRYVGIIIFSWLVFSGCKKNNPIQPPCVQSMIVSGTYIGERYEFFSSTLTDTLYTDTIVVGSLSHTKDCIVYFSDFFPIGYLSTDYQLIFKSEVESGYFSNDSVSLHRCVGGYWNNCQIESYFKGKKQ